MYIYKYASLSSQKNSCPGHFSERCYLKQIDYRRSFPLSNDGFCFHPKKNLKYLAFQLACVQCGWLRVILQLMFQNLNKSFALNIFILCIVNSQTWLIHQEKSNKFGQGINQIVNNRSQNITNALDWTERVSIFRPFMKF